MSNESTEPGNSGARGAEAPGGTGDQQPRQGSARTEPNGAGDSEPKHHFAPGHAPSEQGDKSHPSPEVIKQHQQGLAGSGTGHQGAQGAHGDRSQAESVRGEPEGEHVRSGRQSVPSDRNES